MRSNHIMGLFLLLVIFHYAFLGSVTLVEKDSKYENQIYKNFFTISNDSMTYENNGGQMNGLYCAFDEEETKSWISVGSQGDSYTNPTTKIVYNPLFNYILFTFKNTVLVNRMIYRTAQMVNVCPLLGYPKELKIYYRMRNEAGGFNEGDDDFILADDIKSEGTNKTVLFTFENIINCDQLKIEWVETSYCSSFYKKRASADLIQLLIPETENINEDIINAFSDYNRFTLSEKFNDGNLINQLKTELKELDFSFYPRKYIERIEGVFNGSIVFNPKREFTTNPKETKSNIITQRGDIYMYARNKLLMSRAGLNRQITGIYGRTNDSITIYASSEDNSPLPCIQFSQFAGERVNWKGKEICLKKGEQTLVVEDFLVENYKYKVNPGGPIYIVNKYTSEQQKQNVKIYIEDGLFYPTFRLNDNENEYNKQLKDYLELYDKNKDTYLDLTELYSDKLMITVKASDAYKIYSEENKGPQKNLQAWDEYLTKLYSFYGVQFNEKDPNYNISNNYLNIQFRFNQPLAPYSVTEYIGIYDEKLVNKVLYIVGEETDWELTCLIADMIDIRETFIFGILNKVLAKYSEVVIKKEEENNDLYEEKIKYLTIDDMNNNLRGCEEEDTKLCYGFLQNRRNNYLILWDLESYHHGFWAKMENLYRQEYEITSQLKTTERFVYFCSRAMEIDLGYYFTRWGFYLEGLSTPIFDEEKASNYYKNLMKTDILDGKIKKDDKKFWYLDYKQYNFMDDIGQGCYENKEEYNIQIESVSSLGSQYTLDLPRVRCPGHLGFEIYENDKLIGFTYDTSYTDTNKYEDNYTPKYNIIAYDRLLVPSEPSGYKSP